MNVDSIIKVRGIENNVSVSLNISGDRSMIAFAGIDDYTEFDKRKKKLILLSKHLHVKGLNMERANLLRFAKENGLTTSLDINLQISSQVQLLQSILPFVDIFLPSAWEVTTLFDRTPKQLVKEFGKLVREYCIIKLGREGSIVSDGKSIMKQASNPVRVLDATGAGDAFNAGFLWAYLRREPVEQCLKRGTLAAELCLQTVGGTGWVSRLGDFYEIMKTPKPSAA